MIVRRNRGVFVVECSGNEQYRTPGEVNHRQWISLLCMGIGVVLLLLYSQQALSQTSEKWIARLTSVEGTVEGRRAQQTVWSPATLNDEFEVGDSVRVQAFSRAAILLPDETILRLDQNTTVTFMEPQDRKTSWLNLLRGAIHVISRDPRALRIITPFANAGLEGTEFLVEVSGEETRVTVFEGAVAVSNESGDVNVLSGQSVAARTGQQPVARLVARPRDAVQWTLYYAPILGYELPAADQDARPEQANNPLFYTGRAAQRLAVGRVDEARIDIAQALSLDSTNVDALALQSLIAMTQNDQDTALALANRAVAQDTESAAALIALSYAQQSFFDLSGALANLQRAVERNPKNALAWARLSELWLAVGDLDQAVNSAQTAISLNPKIARTQTVLGFAYLTRVEIAQAIDAFEEAIDLDQAAPLPRLGLGLAMIRDGNLAGGRKEIKNAVIQDTGNALIRSYMGKAHYEEKRDDLAETELKIAKKLDPLDPTPWFYDAIRKQTINQPIAALHDLQTSIERNDNRAVYRSRLMLDEDLAARSASLARIYRDLGFEQLALLEGWKSVSTDPSNYSGHRFLADAYSSLPGHQIARVNELFRSQLLQPINITPIQPQLAEVNLFILDTAGPTELAFNEFNPLFNRNGFAIQGSAVFGGNDTVGEDIVVSGLWDRWSYSLGQFHFETDGFRENNDLDQDVLNAFVQFRPSSKTSVQAEIRSTDTEKGDLALFFDPANFFSSLRQEEHVDSARLGFRRAFTNRSDLLGSFIYQTTESVTDLAASALFDDELDSYQVEVQHLYRAQKWHITSGAGYRENDQSEVTTFAFPNPFPPPPIIEITTTDSLETDFATGYIYAHVNYPDQLTVTIGASFDSLDGRIVDRDRLNPKFGVIWEPILGTTLRAAAFRTLQGPVFSKQNIQPRLEPTQVGSFNQFFFGTEGEEVWRWGLGIDQRVSPGLFAGAEYSQRDREIPVQDPFSMPGLPPLIDEVDVEEDVGRAYVYWAPYDKPEDNEGEKNSQFALSVEYQYENFDNNGRIFAEQFTKLRTHRIPLQFNYFHKSGFNASLKAVYVDQKGSFPDLSAPPGPFPVIVDGEDKFWVFDASLGFRLPKRYGVIAVKINNLFDQEFRFQDTDPENPSIFPERLILLTFTLAYGRTD